MMNKKCEVCKYWLRYSRLGLSGECRRHAPVMVYNNVPNTGAHYEFPKTIDMSWCGDFESKKEPLK